jgi:peptide-methionine (S)-S-oxide reductase
MDELKALFDRLPVGWSVVEYDGRRYGVTRAIHTRGRSESVYAEALDGSDVVSANLYRVDGDDLLKPCEMSSEKVVDFLRLLRTV